MKYKNLNDIPLFGSYTDPYKDRIGNEPTRPKQEMEYVTPHFKQVFDPKSLYVSWLGHSSVFIHMSGKTILIDPMFSMVCAPVPIGMLKRYDGNRMSEKDFESIDIVCITHNHYDHLDTKTMKRLRSKVKQFIVPNGVKKYLIRYGVSKDKIVELSWEESVTIDGLEIVFLPSQHSSARSPFDSNTSLWGSYLFKNDTYTVYDTGDGGYTSYFKKIYESYGPIDLALLECGQYNEKWHGLHMFPEESVQAGKDLHASLCIPVHNRSFILSNHSWNDPVLRFTQRADELELSYKIPKLYEIIKIQK